MSSLWDVSGGRFLQSLSVLTRTYNRAVRGLTIRTLEGVRVFTCARDKPPAWVLEIERLEP